MSMMGWCVEVIDHCAHHASSCAEGSAACPSTMQGQTAWPLHLTSVRTAQTAGFWPSSFAPAGGLQHHQDYRWYMFEKNCVNCWAAAAAKAVQRAKQAAVDAEEDYRVISVYDRAAQKAWGDVQAALERIRQSDVFYRKQWPLKDPKLRPFWKFCRQLDERMQEEPNKQHENGMKKLREYCENLQDGFAGTRPDPEYGYRMYDQLPQEEPMYPVGGGMPTEPDWLTQDPKEDANAPHVPPKLLKSKPVSVAATKAAYSTRQKGVIPYVGGKRYFPSKDPIGGKPHPRPTSWCLNNVSIRTHVPQDDVDINDFF